VTIHQLKKTTHAAEAARDAAKSTLAESKDAYERFVGAFASRLLAQLQDAVNDADWKLAKIRSHDLAELFGALPSSDTQDAATTAAVDSLRNFAQNFAEFLTAKKTSMSATLMKDRWKPLIQFLHRRLDQLKAPFRGQPDGQIRSDNRSGPTPDDRAKPPGEDEVKTSELAPKPSEE